MYDALRDLLLLIQFLKQEKQPWRIVSFSKIKGLSLALPHGCFSHFFKLQKWYQISQSFSISFIVVKQVVAFAHDFSIYKLDEPQF